MFPTANKKIGFPHDCWRPNLAFRSEWTEAAMPPLRGQHRAEPLWRCALHGRRHLRVADFNLRRRYSCHDHIPDVRMHYPLNCRSSFLTRNVCRCWDGVNVDSTDHKSHVAYPSSGTFESSGPCPATHPVKLPQVMYEVMWDTRQFNNKADWPADGSQPFVYSMGDK